MDEEGLAHQEIKDSKPLAVKSCGGCEGSRNSHSHRRVRWKVGQELSKHCSLSDQIPTDCTTMQQMGWPALANT